MLYFFALQIIKVYFFAQIIISVVESATKTQAEYASKILSAASQICSDKKVII